MSRTELLLRTDFDGRALDGAAALIGRGLGDERRHRRATELHPLLDDPAVDPLDRYLTLLVLASWADATGYQAVQVAADLGREVAWYECSVDRLWSVDDSFGNLADAVAWSDELAAAEGTEVARRAAARALTGLIDTEYLANNAGFLVGSLPPREVGGEVCRTVRRAVQALRGGARIPFPVGAQLLDALAGIAESFPADAVALALDVLAVDGSTPAMLRAVAVVDRIPAAQAAPLEAALDRSGEPEVRARVERARSRRAIP